jgi:hypothetical protein
MAGRSRYRSGYKRGSRGFRGRRSAGIERAKQHIREAEELSRELGGTDKDVKEYFFRLTHVERARVLHLYGQKHGEKARQYAEETIPTWQSGRVKMAGQTAARLFDLLPPLMPLQEKYRLAENLWRHVGPRSKRRLRVGLDTTVDDAVSRTREHIEGIVSGYVIPDNLTRRFNWLAAGDVGLKQQLLNHLQELEKKMVVEDARQHLPVMLDHLRRDAANHTARLARTLTVGNHELEILIDRSASGAHLEDWRPQGASPKSSLAWLWWLIGIVAVVAFFALRKKM